jgi:hypothetical protein
MTHTMFRVKANTPVRNVRVYARYYAQIGVSLEEAYEAIFGKKIPSTWKYNPERQWFSVGYGRNAQIRFAPEGKVVAAIAQ